MPLQKITIDKINARCGLKLLVSTLDKCMCHISSSDQFYYNSLIIYFRAMFATRVDIVQDLIDHKPTALETLRILKETAQLKGCDDLNFIADILEYNINYSSNIRKIG